MPIYFMRHGESQANVLRVHAGQRDDSELTEKGLQQARVAAETAKASGIVLQRIISSPLQRAARTAEIFGDCFGIHVESDGRLLEYDMGLASGIPIEGTPNNYKIENPEAEDIAGFKQRVLSIVQEYRDTEEGILLVSHGGVGRIIISSAMKNPPAIFYDIPDIPNCQLVPIETMLQQSAS